MTRDILVKVDIKVGLREYNTLYGVAERDISAEEVMRGVTNYLKHQNAKGSQFINHAILTVSTDYVFNPNPLKQNSTGRLQFIY